MLGKIVATVKGICPLLQHKDDGNREKVSDPGSPEAQNKEFKDAQYRNGKGLFQPSEHFERCFELAGSQFKFKGKLTYSSIIKGGIVIEPQEILHKIQKIVPFAKFVRIPPGKRGARVLSTRALLENWELDFVINILNDAINFEDLKQIVEYAGGYIGIGDWRPKFGRFEVIKFAKLEDKKTKRS